MSATTKNTAAANETRFGFDPSSLFNNAWATGWTDSVRDLMTLQLKTAQFLIEKNIGFGQSLSEFVQNQAHESVRFTQEYAKQGWALTENVKKTAFEMTEKTVRNLNS